MVSAAGFEPTAPGFIPLRLSPPPSGVRGLDCPFTMGRSRQVPPVQSLHLPLHAGHPAGVAWLGIGKAPSGTPAFPDFERIRCEVSQRNAQFRNKESCALSC
jgi:hypothetical protein